ncbi:MAG TPA: hypothetical protein VF618_26680 [Thermoanaerobaculia bacterium]
MTAVAPQSSPSSDRREIRRVVWQQLRSSLAQKAKLLTIAVVAFVIFAKLDDIRKTYVKHQEKAYVYNGRHYASEAAAFEAHDRPRSTAAAKGRRAIAAAAAVDLDAADAQIAQLRVKDSKEKGLLQELDRRITERAALVDTRARRLADHDQQEALDRQDALASFTAVKAPFVYTGKTGLDGLLRDLADSGSPLHIVYEILWIASLTIGILALSYLILVSIFRSLPLPGSEASFEKQSNSMLEKLLSKGLTAKIVAPLAVATAGVVAFSGAAATLPSSPWNAPGATTIVRTHVSTPPPDIVTPPPTTTSPDDPVPDPPDYASQIASLQRTVASQATALQAHGVALDQHAVTLQELGETADGHATRLTAHDGELQATPERIAAVRTAAAQLVLDEELERTRVDDALTANIHNTQKQVSAGVETIGRRATEVEWSSVAPHTIQERPSLAARVLGFDKYQVTEVTVHLLRTRLKVTGDQRPPLLVAVEAMQQEPPRSYDRFAESFKAELLAAGGDQKLYRQWLPVVMKLSYK